MDMKERMRAGLPYRVDDVLLGESLEAKRRARRFNLLDPGDVQGQTALLAEIFGKVGKNCVVCAPLYVDYGKNTEIGEGFFANYNFVVLDVAKVTIGNDVFCGPNVTLTTAGHPVHYEPRNSRYEYGIPIEIGNNVCRSEFGDRFGQRRHGKDSSRRRRGGKSLPRHTGNHGGR